VLSGNGGRILGFVSILGRAFLCWTQGKIPHRDADRGLRARQVPGSSGNASQARAPTDGHESERKLLRVDYAWRAGP